MTWTCHTIPNVQPAALQQRGAQTGNFSNLERASTRSPPKENQKPKSLLRGEVPLFLFSALGGKIIGALAACRPGGDRAAAAEDWR